MRETKDTQQEVESFYRQHGLVDVDMDTPEWQRVRERIKRIAISLHPVGSREYETEVAIQALEKQLQIPRKEMKLLSDIYTVGPTPYIISKIVKANTKQAMI